MKFSIVRVMVPQSVPIGTVASPSPAVSPAYIQTYVGSIQQSKTTYFKRLINKIKKLIETCFNK